MGVHVRVRSSQGPRSIKPVAGATRDRIPGTRSCRLELQHASTGVQGAARTVHEVERDRARARSVDHEVSR
jgi:hypothetical protein